MKQTGARTIRGYGTTASLSRACPYVPSKVRKQLQARFIFVRQATKRLLEVPLEGGAVVGDAPEG
jgi:hypothetical protein